MKKIILFAALSFLAFSANAQKSNFQFSEQWKKVDQLAEKQLPESALKETETIFNEARKAGDFAQTTKAFLYKMRFTLERNPDEAPTLLAEFETFAKEYNKVDEKALLHSMTAELYAMYYQAQQYTISQRTQIEGYTPNNIKEWSKNIFFDKIASELKQSLNPPLVGEVPKGMGAVLIEKSENSATLQPTLFDFLGQRAISILQRLNNVAPIKNPLNNPLYFASASNFIKLKLEETYTESKENLIIEIYQQLLDFRLKENNAPALLYIDLERLNYVRNASEYFDANNLYEKALLTICNIYTDNESVVEVKETLARFYLSQAYAVSKEKNTYKKQAFEIAEKGIDKFPEYQQIDILKNIKAEILRKDINVSYPAVIAPKREFIINTTTTNVAKLELKLYRVNANAQEYYAFKLNNRQDAYPNRTLIETKTITIVPDENFGSVENKINFLSPEYGIYEFSLEQKDDSSEINPTQGSFTVSDFALIHRRIQKEQADVYVLDRVSGKPVAEVDVEICNYEWNGKRTVKKSTEKQQSGKDGIFRISNNLYSNVLFFEKGADCFFCSQANSSFYESGQSNIKNVLTLFTDRSLYRPGQTVYFKGIAYSSQKQEVIKNASFEIKMLDVNWQEVSKKSFKTNEFGSFSGEFVLPESGLNGMYQLQNEFGAVSFYVEEYKRPTFEVKLEGPENEVLFGEKVTFKGNAKAYAGYAVSNAQVKYVIKRNSHRLFWWNYEPPQIVADGIVESNADGDFEVSFVPEKMLNKSSFPLLRDYFYTYTITASITDNKGETQQGIQSVSVGDKSLFIIAETSETYEKQETFSLPIHTETLNGKSTPSLISYTLFQLENGNEYREDVTHLSDLKNKKQVLSGIFDTKNKSLELNLSKYESGYYRLILITPDSQGKEVKKELIFILYSKKDKRPPVKTYSWLTASNTELQHGETAEIHFGSSENISVLYEIMQGNKILESSRININSEIKTFKIPFNAKYGDGIEVFFTFVKDEKIYVKRQRITRKIEEKKLTPQLTVFRDKLKPGETAEWTAAIPETTDGKLLAELMIGMYDASLDAIRPHSWVFNPAYQLNTPSSRAWSGFGFNSGNDRQSEILNLKTINSIKLNQLNWFGLNFYRYAAGGAIQVRGISKLIAQTESMPIAMEADYQVMNERADVYESASDAMQTTSEEQTIEQVQIRSNFNETAFFYPQLKTDKDGNIKFSFTAPESLTRWNVKMLAHTPDLYSGQNEMQVVTQKDVMVQLNMPRFVRRSDKLKLVANVINMTENTLTTNVQLELINPETEKPIALKDNKIKTITLNANETKMAEWEITEFSDFELVIAKVVAQAGAFSDGEQHYLPVLPDKILITESQPLIIRSNETRDFRFDNFIKQDGSIESKSLTIEFTSNPVWYAIQALPTLSAPETENAINYFTAYYVNGLATHIANSNPKISKVFDQWKRVEGGREALLSNLEKNTELKNMLLEETPWVLAAKDETEQKRQIALLFDLNQQKNQGEQYLDKLLKLQKSSGGFTWFEGMNENRYVTQQILLGMARYNKMTTSHSKEKGTWLIKALEYIDLQIAKDFDNLKKNNKNYKTSAVISDMQWFYLHVRSEYKDIAINKNAKEAVDFYTSQAEKYWTKATLYGKAATALICYRNGNTETANDILKSLKENALKTDEMGLYWANNTAGYFWNERPISVQTAIIEAFAEITKKQNDIDEMKIWLLKQKQTQRWDSPISTVDAIYSLLNYGTDWLANEGQVEITLNNKILNPKSKEAGTGYFKQTVSPSSLNGSVVVNINSNSSPSGMSGGAGIGWGAMYWQYFQDIDKVQQNGKSLSVTKNLFIEKTAGLKKTMLPIEQTAIKKGDKIISRLVVTTDRDLEFVALKDLRASCLEPVEQRSRMVWREGVSYYETTKDASTQFFFNYLPKGTYVFEYETWVNNSGEFASGTAHIQCLYAPEFVSYSSGSKIVVE